MTGFQSDRQPYDPDGVDPDPFAFPFPVLGGEPIAGFTPNTSDQAMVAPEDDVVRLPGTERPGPTRRRDRDYRVPRASPRDVFG